MIVLGIVGAPAGGKSTVAAALEKLGATWINADLVAREVLGRRNIQVELIAHFGDEIVDADGSIDRARLASKVFGEDDSSRAALRFLESVIHPPTRVEITHRLEQIESDTPRSSRTRVAILDVPLLFESHWDSSCDEIWYVDSSWETRLARARKRGWDAAELQKRESNQLSIEEKRRRSQRVIKNDGSLDDLYHQIERYWHDLTQSAGNLDTDSHGRCEND
ncbi:Dephospho-CoA kinase [Novipirellula aureliae]|uniref:Dephospho-CoA kinase n=1 Tax=Novipirellula aureliae TaxID=2527966 RepID=A0A5C6E9S6_9BACT|nr:dephospho-CoA kinase [Novipirellula aureliae]TWU45285.1 Dephospho-CoA kinase [Novipirellula aureliae]